MSEAVRVQSKAGKALFVCFIMPLALLLVSVALDYFDTSTELTPSHVGVLNSCFLIAGLAGLTLGGLAIRASRGLAGWRRVPIVGSLIVEWFLAVFMVSSVSADLIEAHTDFPPGQTVTRAAQLFIWRAYRTHGKNQSWDIQTTPLWSNLEVAQSDFEFMLAHRSPEDHGRNPDEISSHGFFCARVTLQQSGNALRILNAGRHKLPPGTVTVCPATDPIRAHRN
jgi:hypothetical protein